MEEKKTAEKKKEKIDQVLGKLEEHGRKFVSIEGELKTFKNEMVQRLDGQERRLDGIDDKISDKFDKVLTGLDKVMGELEKAREDRTFAKAKDDRQDQRLTSLEERADRVEAKVGV